MLPLITWPMCFYWVVNTDRHQYLGPAVRPQRQLQCHVIKWIENDYRHDI